MDCSLYDQIAKSASGKDLLFCYYLGGDNNIRFRLLENLSAGSNKIDVMIIILGEILMCYKSFFKSRSTFTLSCVVALVSGFSGCFAAASTLEEIVVTATKRGENLSKVPIAVTVIGEEEFQVLATGGDDIRMLASRVPNLNIESSYGRVFPRFYLRGLGNRDFVPNATQPVSMYYDEVLFENVALKGMPAFDLERIEVLRGPQGTVWGKNTTAGTIHLVSEKPDSEEVSGYGRMTYGNYSTINMEGAVGGPIIEDVLSGRISLIQQKRDGWVKNISTGNKLGAYEDTAARLQLLYQPSDATSALMRVHSRSSNGTSTLFQQGLADFQNGGPNPARKDKLDFDSDNNNDQENNQTGVSLKIEHDVGGGGFTVTSVTSYEEGDLYSEGEFHPGRQIRATNIKDVSQFTEEVRLSSLSDFGLEWQAGLYYFKEELSYETYNHDVDGDFFSVIDPGNTLYQDASQETDGWAVFGNIGYNITDDLKLAIGVRYTEEEKDFEQEVFVYVADPLDWSNAVGKAVQRTDDRATGEISTDTDGGETTWDISLAYQASDDVNVFARIARGFRSPSIAGSQLSNVFNYTLGGSILAVADTEVVTSYEAGMKTQLLDGRMRFNATVYRWDFEDMQLFFQDPNGVTVLDNATGGVGQGLELEIEIQATDYLNIKANYGYTDAEFEGNELISGNKIGGNEVDNAPKHTANIVLDYTVPVAGGEFFAGTDWSYRAERYFQPINTEILKGDSYWLGGARAGFRTGSGNFEVSGWVRNLTDTEELDGALGFIDAAIMTGPRTYGVDVMCRF